MRGETRLTTVEHQLIEFQSTPLMRGETRTVRRSVAALVISIHSPHARGDLKRRCGRLDGRSFQSTPLMRGETLRHFDFLGGFKHFNPLPSCEGRPCLLYQSCKDSHFNPLPSCEGRPRQKLEFIRQIDFNPLPSCEGRHQTKDRAQYHNHFNPLPSCEGRQHKPPKILLDSRQSIQQKHHSSFF